MVHGRIAGVVFCARALWTVDRQPHHELCTLTGGADQLDASLVQGDELPDHGQAYPDPRADA